jgi:hypothetical protein
VEKTRPERRKAEIIHLWVNTASVVVSALIPVVWDIISGIAN